MSPKHILTNVWSAHLSNAGQNIQHPCGTLMSLMTFFVVTFNALIGLLSHTCPFNIMKRV